MLLSFMSTDLEDKERWLRQAPGDSPAVKTALLQVRADRLVRDGQLREADRAYGEVAKAYSRQASTSSAAANNAALATLERYHCTGKAVHLQRAVEGLEASLRMSPDSSITLTNLATALEYQAFLHVLDRWIRTPALRLHHGEAEMLVGTLADGPLREEVLAALRTEASLRRSREVTKQEQVLAPRRQSSYERDLRWATLTEDREALQGVHERLHRLEQLDSTHQDEARGRWVSGESDEELRRSFEASLEGADAILAAARRTRHSPTLAAAHLLRATALANISKIQPSVESTTEAVAALREAARAWPEIGLERSIAWALVEVARQRAIEEVPALRARWRERERIMTPMMLLYELTTADDGREGLEALRRQPELAEALDLMRNNPPRQPSLSDWLLARVAGETELVASREAALSDEALRLETEASLRLSPNHPDLLARLALLRTGD
jgi:hypothetical protein